MRSFLSLFVDNDDDEDAGGFEMNGGDEFVFVPFSLNIM